MCGRYSLRCKPKAIAEEFDHTEVPPLHPRFNIAPNQPVAVVRFDRNDGARRLDFLTWSLVPSWADDPGYRQPNDQRPIRECCRQACVSTPVPNPAMPSCCRWLLRVAAAGRLETPVLRTSERTTAPLPSSGSGIVGKRTSPRFTRAIFLTTVANEVLAPIHDRMPVLLPRTAYDLWLDPGILRSETTRIPPRPHSR